MNAITDYDIQALVDGELSQKRSADVLKHLENNKNARLHYNTLMKQKNILKRWWENRKISSY